MRHRFLISLLVSSFGLHSSACSGQSLNVGGTDAGSDGATRSGFDVGFGTDAASSDAPGVATAKVVCAQNDGVDFAVDAAPQTPAGISAKLVGRWYSCDATVASAMRMTPAIAFAADGTWTRYAADGAGVLQPLGGIDGTGTWKIFGQDGSFYATTDTTPGTYPYIYLVNSMGGDAPVAMTFDDSPRILYAEEATSGLRTYLVPLP